VGFSPSAKLFSTCAESLRVWDFPSGVARFHFVAPSGVWSAAWTKSENSIAAAGADGIVRIWDCRFGKPFLQLDAPADAGPLQDFSYHEDSAHLTANYSRRKVTWDLANGQSLPTADVEFVSAVEDNLPVQPWNAAVYSEDRRRLAKYSNDAVIIIYDSATGEETQRLDAAVGGHKFQFAPDGTSMIESNTLGQAMYYWPGKR
jgi:hypothetical protein